MKKIFFMFMLAISCSEYRGEKCLEFVVGTYDSCWRGSCNAELKQNCVKTLIWYSDTGAYTNTWQTNTGNQKCYGKAVTEIKSRHDFDNNVDDLKFKQFDCNILTQPAKFVER